MSQRWECYDGCMVKLEGKTRRHCITNNVEQKRGFWVTTVAEMRMLWWMYGKTRNDRFKNEYIRVAELGKIKDKVMDR